MSPSSIQLLPWSDALKIGVELVDDEHHKLVDAMNELHARLILGHTRQGCSEALDAMREYVHTHFTHEEGLMAESRFPRLAGHRTLHRSFARHVGELTEACPTPEAATRAEAEELLNYLRDWIMDHILGADMLFAVHYKAWLARR